MEKIAENLKTKKMKQFFAILTIAILIGWVVFRFAAVASENSRHVFNASRVAIDQGMPIEAIVVSRTDGVLREPIAVKNNRALVSGARAAKLRAGQKIGDGKIVSVSRKIDYDTGMHIVRTSGVSDGLQFAEISGNGFYVPISAIENNTLMIVEDGVASARDVVIAAQDATMAQITSGLNDGDRVILSNVSDGTKVKVIKK
ncbi:MAG: hypothetical protein E7009_04405 [Alphaproteobacteria bacterium]|nr:hypothetical protein [Alphaproteobacteria bacterium]